MIPEPNFFNWPSSSSLSLPFRYLFIYFQLYSINRGVSRTWSYFEGIFGEPNYVFCIEQYLAAIIFWLSLFVYTVYTNSGLFVYTVYTDKVLFVYTIYIVLIYIYHDYKEHLVCIYHRLSSIKHFILIWKWPNFKLNFKQVIYQIL